MKENLLFAPSNFCVFLQMIIHPQMSARQGFRNRSCPLPVDGAEYVPIIARLVSNSRQQCRLSRFPNINVQIWPAKKPAGEPEIISSLPTLRRNKISVFSSSLFFFHTTHLPQSWTKNLSPALLFPHFSSHKVTTT